MNYLNNMKKILQKLWYKFFSKRIVTIQVSKMISENDMAYCPSPQFVIDKTMEEVQNQIINGLIDNRLLVITKRNSLHSKDLVVTAKIQCVKQNNYEKK